MKTNILFLLTAAIICGTAAGEEWRKIGGVVAAKDEGVLFLDHVHGTGKAMRPGDFIAVKNFPGVSNAVVNQRISFQARRDGVYDAGNMPVAQWDCLPAQAPKLPPELQSLSDQMRPVYLSLVKLQQQRATLAKTIAAKEAAKQDTSTDQANLTKLDAEIAPLAEKLKSLQTQYQTAKAKLDSEKADNK